jgi:HAD superfamily hydrolase (TIGR01490 family)
MQVAAFFDLDWTVLSCSSGSRWVRYLRRRRELTSALLLRSIYWSAQYKLSILDMESVAGRLAATMTGAAEQELIDKTRAFVHEELLETVTPAARARIESHRQQRHVLALLTSSTPYVAEPLARHIDIPHVLCTRLHVEDGRFLGTCERPTCYGQGKVHHAERFAQAHGIDLARSYFYTDSYSDLPMLLRVGERRVINPDARLLRHARRSGWEIEKWY